MTDTVTRRAFLRSLAVPIEREAREGGTVELTGILQCPLLNCRRMIPVVLTHNTIKAVQACPGCGTTFRIPVRAIAQAAEELGVIQPEEVPHA